MRLIDALSFYAKNGRHYANLILAGSRGDSDLKQFDRYWTLTQAIQMIDCSTAQFKNACATLTIEPKTRGLQKSYSLADIQAIRELLRPRQPIPKGNLPIIGVLAGKGGSAKSTWCVHLAQKLVLNGKRVLLVDTDPQGSATMIVLGVNPDVTFDSDDTVAPFMMRATNSLKEQILKTGMSGLDVIPCCQGAAIMDMQGIRASNETQEEAVQRFWSLRAELESMHTHYDVVIIDTPPTLSYSNIRSAISANLVITPIGPSLYDLCSSTGFENTLKDFLESLLEVDDSLPQEIHNRRFVIARYNHQLSGHRSIAEVIRKAYPSTYNCPFAELTEIVNADKNGNTVYDQQRAVNSSSTRKKALEHLDDVFEEVLIDIENITSGKSLEPTKVAANG